MKNDLSGLAKAIHCLIEAYDLARRRRFVKKPITYALRVVWAEWEEREESESTKEDEDD